MVALCAIFVSEKKLSVDFSHLNFLLKKKLYNYMYDCLTSLVKHF